ncbi:V-type ATP synthase subunit D [Prescottella equi]|uniref:V-type ATP synthase subunit D n=1 Tax=Rhodococcus hoagii TaxID=43767 RepID=UPI00301D0B85
MTRIGRVPPGRAGGVWLRRRIDVAVRGVELLDRKRRVLQTERDRLEREAARTSAEWVRTSREADRWVERAVLLGGDHAIRIASGPPAQISVEWSRVIGVTYPAGVDFTSPDPGDRPFDGPAVAEAREHSRQALAVAAAHAAALAAVRLVDAELQSTTRRMRAISDRWIPALEGELARLRLELEEQEHADLVRRRWAADRSYSN